jgi:hypothetical protein
LTLDLLLILGGLFNPLLRVQIAAAAAASFIEYFSPNYSIKSQD